MIESNDKNRNSLYVKKKVVLNRKPNSLFLDDDELSLQSSPIDIIIEEKTCTANESECPQREQRDQREPEKFNEVSQSTIEHIRGYSDRDNFRKMVKGLMKKRTDSTYIRGRFKPEIYYRDFIYYFNLHKFIIMLRKSSQRASIYQKASNNVMRYSYGLQNHTSGEQSSENTNIFTNNLNLSVYPKKSTGSNVSKLLTKIPNKLNGDNRRLDMAYTKAKDAARVVRRLEYSYNMKMNLLYSKPIHKVKAQIIQKWWRKQAKEKNEIPFAIKIQKVFRGFLTRLAFKQTLRFIQYLPFLSLLHSKFYYKLNQAAFDTLLFRFGIRTLESIITPQANMLVRKVKSYLTNRLVSLHKVYQIKCSFSKFIFDRNSSRLLQKLQGKIKIFLMKKNERIMLHYGSKIHPHLYFFLKYRTQKYKRKIVSFRRLYHRLREFNLQVNKGLESKFDYLPFIIKKMHWNTIKEYNEEAKKSDDNLPIKRRLFRKTLFNNDKKNLTNALNHWKLYTSVHKRFIKPLNRTLLKMMVKTLQLRVNISSSVFFSKLQTFTYKRLTKREAMKTVLAIKNQLTPSSNLLMNKFFQLWRMNSARMIFLRSSRKLNRFLNTTKKKYLISKAVKHFYFNGFVQMGIIYKKASLIKMILKKNLSRHVFIKLRSILFKQKMQSLIKSVMYPLRNRFLQWSYENKKYKKAIKGLFANLKGRILRKKRQIKLTSIYDQLKSRLIHHHLRKGFLKYRIKSGVYYRHPRSSNLQLLFFNKKKKQISSMKYRMLRYTVNKITLDQEDLRMNGKLIEKWDIWKRAIADYKLRKFLKRKCKRITAYKALLKRNRMMYWKKLNKLLSKPNRLTSGSKRA